MKRRVSSAARLYSRSVGQQLYGRKRRGPTSRSFAAFIEAERQRYADIVREAGMLVE